eukprot:Amastigsp_a517062_11.p5 type:complete len:113 gc:universal Amastigsp_a517062_11:547-885(+)
MTWSRFRTVSWRKSRPWLPSCASTGETPLRWSQSTTSERGTSLLRRCSTSSLRSSSVPRAQGSGDASRMKPAAGSRSTATGSTRLGSSAQPLSAPCMFLVCPLSWCRTTRSF